MNKVTYNFDNILDLLKQGHKVTRLGWNDVGTYLWLMPEIVVKRGWVRDTNNKIESLSTSVTKVTKATGETISGWLPSQIDEIATDWIIIKQID